MIAQVLGESETGGVRATVGVPEEITVHLDAGDDSGKTREALAARGLSGEIAHKGEQAPIQAGRRWHVERTNAWLTPSTGSNAATNAARP